jgi:hypothetical protein
MGCGWGTEDRTHMIDRLRRGDLRELCRCRDTLLEQHRRRRRNLDALSATVAGVLRPNVETNGTP